MDYCSQDKPQLNFSHRIFMKAIKCKSTQTAFQSYKNSPESRCDFESMLPVPQRVIQYRLSVKWIIFSFWKVVLLLITSLFQEMECPRMKIKQITLTRKRWKLWQLSSFNCQDNKCSLISVATKIKRFPRLVIRKAANVFHCIPSKA